MEAIEPIAPQDKAPSFSFDSTGEKPYFPLAGISTTAATPSTVQFENLKQNVKLGLPRLNHLPEFQKIKGSDVPIAIVGGGPDLINQLDELRKFRTIFAAGSSHDFLIRNGIIPTYAGICDPDPVGVNYFQVPHTETKYLISSGCDPLIFKHLESYQRILWHCHSDDWNDKVNEIEPEYLGVGGGCTIGLRCISISMMLGYGNIHLFGFDSCLHGHTKEGYSYNLSTEKEKKDRGSVFAIKMSLGKEDNPREEVYFCLGYHIAQAEHFKDFWAKHHQYFYPTFHGKGMLPDYINMIQAEERRMVKEAEQRKVAA